MTISWHGIVIGLAALFGLQADAATFSPIPSGEAYDLVQLPDGRVAAVGSTTDWPIDAQTGNFVGEPTSHAFAHVIDPQRGGRQDIEIPMPGEGIVVGYRQGFVTWGRNAATYEVRYIETSQIPRQSVLHSTEGLDYLYLTGSPAGDSLYVAESLSRGGMRLLRFDSSGKLAWSKSYDIPPMGVTATNDGVVFIRPGPQRNNEPLILLTKLGLDGEETWSSPAGESYGGVSTVRFHSRQVITVANAEQDESMELLSYDATTGRQLSTFRFPGYPKLVGTADGLLLIHSYLYRPYIAMLGSDGSLLWWRRYTPDESLGSALTGTILRGGLLALLTRTPDRNQPATHKVVFMKARGEELGSACTRRDPLPVLRSERTLHAKYGIRLAIDYDAMNARAHKLGCPHPTEDEYAAAVAAFADRFAGDAATRIPWEESVYVQIMGSGPAMTLSSYYLGMGPTDAPGSLLSFSVRYDNAKPFAKYVEETVLPHMARMQEARNRFRELTHQVYGAHAPEGEIPDADEFLAQMERAAGVLEARVRARGRGAWPSRLWVGAILYPTQFGTFDERQPLDVADQTLLELIEKAETRQR
ncbi:MAG TPA: hypothetical protein VJS12_07375 [Steroidobacteraceae bacterium]|nr:hypothetical protein [Steroidobacteraceae bacterium]